MGWCGYCHDSTSFYCPNYECRCENSRASVCKECGMSQHLICQHCGSRFVEEDELEFE